MGMPHSCPPSPAALQGSASVEAMVDSSYAVRSCSRGTSRDHQNWVPTTFDQRTSACALLSGTGRFRRLRVDRTFKRRAVAGRAPKA